jgi:hypothetical protein
MKRTAAVALGVAVISTFGSWTAAEAKTAPVAAVTASISCGANTSADVIITPVDVNDFATGGPLAVGCGQYFPSTATEGVTPGTTRWNYSGFYYPIGATTTTSLTGRVNLGKVVRASIKGAKVNFSLASS